MTNTITKQMVVFRYAHLRNANCKFPFPDGPDIGDTLLYDSEEPYLYTSPSLRSLLPSLSSSSALPFLPYDGINGSGAG
jgi:hypothetical protein